MVAEDKNKNKNKDKDKKTNRLLLFLVLVVLVSIGVNVYLFWSYGDQDDAIEVMASWQEELSSVTDILANLEVRQSVQETVTQEVLNLLEAQPWTASSAQIQEGFSSLNESLALMHPDGVDRETWNTANIQVQEALSLIRVMLYELEARQSTQGVAIEEIVATLDSQPWGDLSEKLAQIEMRQVAQASEPIVEPDWVDKESWEAANMQIQEELSSIKAMITQLLAEQSASIPAMAPAQAVTYVEETEGVQSRPVVEVRLRPGDSVWSIVSRFCISPSPALVDQVVEFNNIEDPRRLPVGFPVRLPLDIVNGI